MLSALQSRLSAASTAPTRGARALAARGLCTSAQKVTANGVQLHVVTSGDASLPPLLCMPGGLGTAETDFGPQLRELSDSFQVVSCDPRGYGQSRPPVRDFPPDFYQRDADDAAAVMRALGHERYAVMGWSDGAIAAVMLAASQRAAVRRLVIFGGNAYMGADDADAFEAALLRLCHSLLRGSPCPSPTLPPPPARRPPAASPSKAMRDIGGWSKRMRETHLPMYGEDLQPMWSAATDAWLGIIAKGGDVCMAQARAVECPALVLHGEKEPLPVDAAHRLAQVQPAVERGPHSAVSRL